MFLRYICENYKVRAFSSAHQYLLQFKQLYNRVNGKLMDTNDAKEAFKVRLHTLSLLARDGLLTTPTTVSRHCLSR
jgi:hypothetical protein